MAKCHKEDETQSKVNQKQKNQRIKYSPAQRGQRANGAWEN